MQLPRTIWAEHEVGRFVIPGFIAEFVFRSPHYDRKSPKEVVDFLFVRADQSILVSQECREDPTVKTGMRLQRWTRKSARSAGDRLKGALRWVGTSEEIWCEHWRRGRVTLMGLPKVTHVMATIEVKERIILQNDLELVCRETPITYLSLNDFLNLCDQLRTGPELVRYIYQRKTLPTEL